MFVESVVGDYCGWLRSYRFVRSNWLCDAWLHFYGHRAATLERHACQSSQTHCTVALSAGGPGEIASQLHRMQCQHFFRCLNVVSQWEVMYMHCCNVAVLLLVSFQMLSTNLFVVYVFSISVLFVHYWRTPYRVWLKTTQYLKCDVTVLTAYFMLLGNILKLLILACWIPQAWLWNSWKSR